MRLIHMYVRTASARSARGVSVWVDEADAAAAEQRAIAILGAQGLQLDGIDSSVETSADDYFRACPSQHAFHTAQSTGIAWRFDDE
jgi:hypothetical protein